MKTLYKILIPVAAVVLLIILCVVLVSASSTREAFLTIDKGSVEVDTGNGWVTATDGVTLSKDDKVRTLADGRAILVFQESIIVELEPNTEVTVGVVEAQKVALGQDSGKTWNKFTAIAGVKDYEVTTPNTVATVRGTSFWMDMFSCGVTEGTVHVKTTDNEKDVTAGFKMDDSIVKPLTDEEKKVAIAHMEAAVKVMKNLRADEINKHPVLLAIVKARYGWTDQDIAAKLEKLDNGEASLDQVRANSPIPLASLEKMMKITEEIRKEKEAIARLSAA